MNTEEYFLAAKKTWCKDHENSKQITRWGECKTAAKKLKDLGSGLSGLNNAKRVNQKKYLRPKGCYIRREKSGKVTAAEMHKRTGQ